MKMKWTILLPVIAMLGTSNLSGEITRMEYDHLFATLLPPEQESGWLALEWETDLWKARERAAREGKPIFLWEMDGHPLGCT